MTFSERLKAMREDGDYSQRELGEVLNLTAGALSHYENGSREPDITTLIKITDYLNVSLDYLVGRTNCNIKYEKILKPYTKGVTMEEIISRISKLDSEHRKIIVSVLSCVETDQYVVSKTKK